MRPARFALWRCLLLLLAGIGTVVTAAISDEGKQAIEQLRQRHQSAEAEPTRPKMRGLAVQLRKKHERPNQPPLLPITDARTSLVKETTLPTETTLPVAVIERQIITTEDQSVASAATSSSEYGYCSDDGLLAEKYDHTPDTDEPERKPQTSATRQQKSAVENDNDAYSGFFTAVLAVIMLFSVGSALAADSGGRGSPPGVLQATGTLMLLGAIVVGGVTVIKFWPILLLLFFGYVFSQASRSSNDSGCCGCGCGLILLLILLGVL